MGFARTRSNRRLSIRCRLAVTLASVVVGVVALPCAGAAAQVPAVDITCVATGQFTFSPPLNFNTTSVSVAGAFSNCFSPSGSQPQLSSAVLSFGGIASGCWPFPATMGGTGGTFTWNDGSVSTFDWTVSTDPFGAPLGLSATITSGPMTGDSGVGVPVLLSQNGLCLLGGVHSFGINLAAVVFTS